MSMHKKIDITFDFRSDTPRGKDPDSFSPTLKKYHKLLWSKPLPGGVIYELVDTTPHVYLHHKSKSGEFYLSSDLVIPTFLRRYPSLPYIHQIPQQELDEFDRIAYTIGGMMVFPGNRIEGKMTINGARGLHPRIKDRFDLTVECIRRHYHNEENPLSKTLERYADFFALFEDFRGYAEFFYLQDLVSQDFNGVKFFAPFDDFKTSPIPASMEAYIAYKQHAINFIEARNSRILELA